jgi:Sap, sulfolipid-1-addressing protein
MPNWLEIVLLAFASMFWPTLITIVVLALRVPQPVRILAWFLFGGLLTTITIGLILVFALQDSNFVSGPSKNANPVLNIAAGLLALGSALYLSRRKHAPVETAPARAEAKKPSLTERAVERGGLVAFIAGVVLNIVPGAFPFVALKDIAQLDVSDAGKVVSVIVFYVIMFAFAEVPIVAYLFAPERTTVKVNQFNDWLRRNSTRVSVWVLVAVGIYLTVRGVVQAVS